MTSEENGKVQQKQYERQTSDAWGPTVAIIILATIVFFVVNGPQSSASNTSNRETVTKEATFSSTAILGDIERVRVEFNRQAIVFLHHGAGRASCRIDRQPAAAAEQIVPNCQTGDAQVAYNEQM